MITLLLVLSAIISLSLGSLVLIQRPRVLSVAFFFLTMVSTTVWSLGVALFLSVDTSGMLLKVATVYYIAAAAISCFTLLFAFSFAKTKPFSSWLVIGILLPFVALASVIGFSPELLISSVAVSEEANTASLKPFFYLIYTVYFTSYYLAALVVFWRRRRRANRVLQKHFAYIFAAYALAGVVGMVFNLFLPAFGDYHLIWAGPLGLLVFVPIVYLAIAKYGLFDIRQTVVRTVAYIFSLLTLAGIYYLFAYIVATLFLQSEVNSAAVSISPVNILLALALAFIFQPIKNFFDRITNQIFYRGRYDSGDFFARFNEVLSTTTDLRGLLQRAAVEIAGTLKARQAFFYAQYHQAHHISAGTKGHSVLPVRDAQQLNDYVDRAGAGIILTDMLPADHPIQRLLISHRIALLMPIMQRDNIIGYLALGDQQGGGYTRRDIKVLSTISDGLVIAIQNALSIQEVKDLNSHLQQRIDFATKELRASNARLRHMDSTKDEFLSLASHQLRTPLTSVKGYLSMVLDGDAGKITQSQRHLLSEAFSSSERMVHLIHDFLNVSRLQNGKFMLERRSCDLVKLIRDEIDGLESVAGSRDMKLKLKTKLVSLPQKLDENKIRQVVMNFIDNAMFYSKEGADIIIEIRKVGSMVEVMVHDKGIGVPKAEVNRLFTKFYRASNARRQRPDGTGVGLFLAKKVINAHGGEILFESVENKGSGFGFRLPIEHGESKSAND